MKLDVKLAGHHRSVEIERRADRFAFLLDDQEVQADIFEISLGIYSVLLGGESFEVRVEERSNGLILHVGNHEFPAEIIDPRQWRRGRRGSAEAEGRQQVLAPMPGKVVRVMIQEGGAIEAGQGLLVVEAMKMQNEIKSPKSGKIESLLVREGQAVNAGEVLAVVV